MSDQTPINGPKTGSTWVGSLVLVNTGHGKVKARRGLDYSWA